MIRPKHLPVILMVAFFLLVENMSYAGERAPFFDLPQWETDKRFNLDDFKGQIVVLDFFSASCSVCFRASWEIGIDIEDFYEARSGNPHGIPVKVIAVNSDIANQDDMNAFLEETELDLVLNDSNGTLLQYYGGATLPYLAVIDATGTEPGTGAPRIVYRESVYNGVDKLRRAIDAITGQAESPDYGVSTLAENTPKADQLITHEAALDNATLAASDLFVTDTQIEYTRKHTSKEFSLALSYRRIDVDYASEYIGVSREKNLTADHISFQGSASFDMTKALTLNAGGGLYDGFQTYRALWLDQYYRHVFDVLSGLIEGLEGYENAHPWGYNLSSGLRWEYLPDTGFAEMNISYQYDIVSPGYDMGIEVVRLRDTYHTISAHLAFENVLTRRLRTLAECRIDNTTDRDVRFTLQGSLNYAMADHWVLRLTAGGAKEEPEFTSKSVSAVLEHDWHETWFTSLFGRYYEDSSEIGNAITVNAAAPPLETYQAGLGLRRQGHHSSFKLVMGPCFSRYEKHPDRDMAFDQLYKDRDWFSVQAAFVHQF